jgi:hypothetical protein
MSSSSATPQINIALLLSTSSNLARQRTQIQTRRSPTASKSALKILVRRCGLSVKMVRPSVGAGWLGSSGRCVTQNITAPPWFFRLLISYFCQDPAQAEHVLGQSIGRTTPYLPTPDVSPPSDPAPADPFLGSSRVSNQHSLSGSRSPLSGTPTVGTPIRLAPSTSAFRKPGQGQGQGQGPKAATGGQQLTTPAAVGTPGTPSKSMLGQFSDLVFGW